METNQKNGEAMRITKTQILLEKAVGGIISLTNGHLELVVSPKHGQTHFVHVRNGELGEIREGIESAHVAWVLAGCPGKN